MKITALFFAVLCVTEACWLARTKREIRNLKSAQQVALQAAEEESCNHVRAWVDWMNKEVNIEMPLKLLRAGLAAGDSAGGGVKCREAVEACQIYRSTFQLMTNDFKARPHGGVRVRGRVFQEVPGGVTIECDDVSAEGEPYVGRTFNRVGRVGAEIIQLGYCDLRAPKGKFGISSKVDIIGDDMQVVTYTNNLGLVMQQPTYVPR